MIRLALLFVWLAFQEEAPYKSKDEFEIKVAMSFKQRATDGNTVHLATEKNRRDNSVGMLPFLTFHLKILKVQSPEFKAKIIRDDKFFVMSKKVNDGVEIKLDAGFTDDIKDRVEGYKHQIEFYSEDKKICSRILIEFDKDGNYF